MRPEERLDVVSRSTSEDGSTVGWLRSDMMIQYGGFHTWGYPNSWMVFVRENPIYKWMMTGGTPILPNPQINWGMKIYLPTILTDRSVTSVLSSVMPIPDADILADSGVPPSDRMLSKWIRRSENNQDFIGTASTWVAKWIHMVLWNTVRFYNVVISQGL